MHIRTERSDLPRHNNTKTSYIYNKSTNITPSLDLGSPVVFFPTCQVRVVSFSFIRVVYSAPSPLLFFFFLFFLGKLQIAVGTTGPQQQAPDHSGQPHSGQPQTPTAATNTQPTKHSHKHTIRNTQPQTHDKQYTTANTSTVHNQQSTATHTYLTQPTKHNRQHATTNSQPQTQPQAHNHRHTQPHTQTQYTANKGQPKTHNTYTVHNQQHTTTHTQNHKHKATNTQHATHNQQDNHKHATRNTSTTQQYIDLSVCVAFCVAGGHRSALWIECQLHTLAAP